MTANFIRIPIPVQLHRRDQPSNPTIEVAQNQHFALGDNAYFRMRGRNNRGTRRFPLGTLG